MGNSYWDGYNGVPGYGPQHTRGFLDQSRDFHLKQQREQAERDAQALRRWREQRERDRVQQQRADQAARAQREAQAAKAAKALQNLALAAQQPTSDEPEVELSDEEVKGMFSFGVTIVCIYSYVLQLISHLPGNDWPFWAANAAVWLFSGFIAGKFPGTGIVVFGLLLILRFTALR